MTFKITGTGHAASGGSILTPTHDAPILLAVFLIGLFTLIYAIRGIRHGRLWNGMFFSRHGYEQKERRREFRRLALQWVFAGTSFVAFAILVWIFKR